MNVTADRTVNNAQSVRKPTTTEIVSAFDPELLKAPFLLRVGALLIDYILFVSIPIIFLIIGRLLGEDGGKLISGQLTSAGWMIAVLLVLTDFLIFPMFTGQTLGKMLTGLQIVTIDGHEANLKKLALRHFVGYPLTIALLPISFLMGIFSSRGRTIHDLIAGTLVVYGKRKII